MKKRDGFSLIGILAGIASAALLIVATIAINNKSSQMTDFDDYDFYSVIKPTVDNGNIGDHIKGGDENAQVIIFEYADYQCPGCASINSKINTALSKFDGKVAVVYRSMLLSYHQNGTAAASAAEAAGLQGYWKPYADILFANQREWEYASPSERTVLFDTYFNEVTEYKGDIEKFHTDITSEAVSKKINFDMGIAKRIDVSATPALYVEGQNIKWTEASAITINGKVISWDKSIGDTEGLTKLFQDILDAKN